MTTDAPPMTPSPTAPPAPPTTPAPTAPPSGGPTVPSPLGKIFVSVCIADGLATVGLENVVYRAGPWNGSTFGDISFNPFSTGINNYPALKVKGELNGDSINVTVSSTTSSVSFIITPGGAQNCSG